MADINGLAAWVGILAGALSGSVGGLWFHRDAWLGGYASWRRRMVRLGHIAFFGIAFLNLAYILTLRSLHWPEPPQPCGWALASAEALMPGVCYLSAWRKPFRHLFALPVACVLAGAGGLLWRKLV